ncbi:ATP-binding cassette domain-containing protein [Thermococcus sp. 21S7]|uniref:ABC transporter ATP-binding protein n=1 Tax=Thermococcus sp. 21S7 TaxID=1638221 RepID=UPI00143ADABA|nr:ATP-binding cassette domain-containing protein [Thermococcus sp. 21S7]NJE60872.1 ATP-binding cassette domain-containing protein [Thermococcus sp. 21S7]
MSVLRHSFSRYWELSRSLRKRQAVIVLVNLVVSYLNIRFALMLRDAINSPGTGRILTLGVFLVLINALSFVVTYLLEVSKRAMQVEIIGRIYRRILHAKEETFRAKTPGEYLTDLISNVVYVSSLSAALIPALIVNAVSFGAYLIALFLLSPRLSLVLLPFLIITVLLFKKQVGELAKVSAKERSRFSMLVERIRTKLEGRKTIRNTSALNGAVRKLNEECSGWYNSVKSLVLASLKYRYLYNTLYRLVPLISVLVGLLWKVDTGTLVAFYMMAGEVIEPLVVILSDLSHVPESYPALKRIDEALNMEEESFGDRTLMRVESIELKNVSYSGILENVNLRISHGDSIGIIGESGSGKTTLANIIACHYRPEKGEVLINSVPAFEFRNPREKIVLVETNEFVFPGTVRENITLWEKFDEEALRDVMEVAKVDLPPDEKIGPGHREVSLGERQRIALARALIRRPEVLILDEALSGVDPDVEAEIIEKIKARGITLIAISHRPSTTKLVDRIVLVEKRTAKEL